MKRYLLIVGGVAALFAFIADVAAAPATSPRTEKPQTPAAALGRKTPDYAVMENLAAESAADVQTVTVDCPEGLKAMGAGYAAQVRDPKAPKGAPPLHQEMLAHVWSLPEARGFGWRVQGALPADQRGGQPWRLAIRLVCVRSPG